MYTAEGMRPRRHPRSGTLTLSLATVSCVVALTACGSSVTSNPGSVSGGGKRIRLADCMRSHGVPNFPDPSVGGGIQINGSSGINLRSPAFQSAQSACSKLLPGGGPGAGPAPESRRLAMVKLAQCMRKHGLSTFPDPTATPPSPGAGFGVAFGVRGSFIAVPRSMMQSPAFNQAAAACDFPGTGKGRGKTKVTPGP